MLAVRVKCPFCAKPLRFRQAPAAGRRLLCTGCDRTFPVEPEMIETFEVREAAPAAPALVAPSPPPRPSPSQTPLPASVLTAVAPPAPLAQEGMSAGRRNLILGG